MFLKFIRHEKVGISRPNCKNNNIQVLENFFGKYKNAFFAESFGHPRSENS